MLLERKAELLVLRKAVLEIQSGPGSLVLIDGPAGSGTSSLLHELARLGEESGARVLRASGAASERGFPLGVVRQLVMSLLAEPAPEIPDAARMMLAAVRDGTGLGPDDTVPDKVLADVLHGLHTLLAALGMQRPVVLVVDDLHWVDAASLRALAFLATRLDGMRVLIGVVRQDGVGVREPVIRDIASAMTVRLRSRALSAEATTELLVSRFGPGCADSFAAACHELTGGSPKELQVLFDRARSQGLTGRASEEKQVRALGGSFRRERLLLLLRRDALVDAFARAVVVLGDQATGELVARLSGLNREECAHARQVLGKAWLLPETGRPVAQDPATARAIAESMEAKESSRMHRTASVLLEEYGAGAEAVAAPLLHVEKLRGDWEIRQLRAAAVTARRRNAPQTAVRYLRRALVEIPVDSRDRAELLAELAAAELATGAASAGRHLGQAVRLLPETRRRVELVALAPLYVVGNDPQLADLVREIADGMGPPGPGDRYGTELRMRLEARSRYAGPHDPKLLTTAARRLGELGEDTPPESAAERELRAVLLFTAALCGQVDSDRLARMARRILDHEPATSMRLSPALELLPSVLFAADAADAAAPWLDVALAHARRQNAPDLVAQVEAQRGLVLVGRGEAAQARESAVRAFALTGRGVHGAVVRAAVTLGLAAVEAHDDLLATQVIEVSEPTNDLRLFALQRSLRGRLAEARGDLHSALAQYLDCGGSLDRAGWRNPAISSWQVSAARVQQQLGRTEEALELAEEYHRRAQVWGAPTPLARALRLLGALTEGPPGEALLRGAVETLQSGGSRLELARALIALGKRLQPTAPAEGDQLLGQGRRLADRLQTVRDGETADDLNRAGVPTAGSVLTRGEATVAKLAACGRTNREIAEELAISRRAVEKHLTSSYRKLEIDGRAALAMTLGYPGNTQGSFSG